MVRKVKVLNPFRASLKKMTVEKYESEHTLALLSLKFPNERKSSIRILAYVWVDTLPKNRNSFLRRGFF